MMKSQTKAVYRLFILSLLIFAGCKHANKPATMEVTGTLINTSSKKIFLAELPFGSTQRTILDTAILDKEGHFKLSTPNKGEGIFQIFIENGPGIMLVNDINPIELHADGNQLFNYTTPGSKVNDDIHAMYRLLTQQDSVVRSGLMLADSLKKAKAQDSAQLVATSKIDQGVEAMKKTLHDFITTQPNGTAVYFALRMAMQLHTESEWNTLLQTALKRFPHHPGLQLLQVSNTPSNTTDQQKHELVGKPIPDVTLPDTSGHPISVSSFKGKWLLVDFWASWCGPCRMENPNVVAAYNRFKDKNFTILGISLDLQKNAWLKAIQKDKLTWTHVSDLKQWQSKVVDIYKFDAIPFNILIDPTGKVVATNLQGEDLQRTLAEKLVN